MVACGSGVRTSEVATLFAAMSDRARRDFHIVDPRLQFICPSRACADLERARLLHQYALDRSSADAQRLADLQYARAVVVEPQDALFQHGSAHAPALFICASLAVLLICRDLA